MHACKHNSWEVRPGRSEVQGHSWTSRDLEASQSYLKVPTWRNSPVDELTSTMQTVLHI